MWIAYFSRVMRSRWNSLKATRDGGYSTETVIVVAALAACALVVVALIVAGITSKASSINFE